MALNDRSLALVLRNIARPENYRSLLRMRKVYRRPGDASLRYFLGRGDYPVQLAVRSPVGDLTPTIHHSHDVITLNEIFCREDYRSGPEIRTVVDIGSNIGLSALYFLTRHPMTRCVLYEPDPLNVPKLRQNLSGHEDRYELHVAAVAGVAGDLPFWTEQYGRYGGLSQGEGEGEHITVEVRHIDDVLRDALATADVIDVLKIDTEGHETSTLQAADPALLARVRVIYYESFDDPIDLPGFEGTTSCDTVHLANTAPS